MFLGGSGGWLWAEPLPAGLWRRPFGLVSGWSGGSLDDLGLAWPRWVLIDAWLDFDEAAVVVDRAGEDADADDRPGGLVDEVDDFTHGGRQWGTGDDDLTRSDDRRVGGLIEERSHEAGFVLAVVVGGQVDVRHRSRLY